MASSARRIVVEFLGEDKGLSRTAAEVESHTSKMGKTFASVGKAAALGLAGGVAIAGTALVGMAKNAISDEASQRKLKIALENATGATDKQVSSVEDYITKAESATGITDEDLRDAFGRLVQSTGSVSKAQRELNIAMNVSAGTGKSMKTVTEAMMKANNGTTASLSRLGLKTKDAAGNTLTMNQALGKMAETFKGQAAAQADSMQGKMLRLSTAFDEIKENIGYAVIPILSALADVILKYVIPAFSDLSAWFTQKIQPKLKEFSALVGQYFTIAFGYIRDHMAQIKATISTTIAVIMVIWNQFGKHIFSVVVAVLKSLILVIKGAFNIIKGIFEVFSGLIHGDWSKVWQGIKDILKGAWQIIKGLVQAGWSVIKNLFQIAGNALKDLFKGIWAGILALLKAELKLIVSAITDLPGMIMKLGGLFGKAGKFLIGAFVDGLKNAAGLVSDVAGNIWNAVKSFLNDAISKINSALEFTINLPFGKHITINPPDIPHLAKGGIVTSPTMALIGEAGPEAVIPLGRGNAVRQPDSFMVTAPLVIQLDGRNLWQGLLKVKRENGNVALGLA